MKKVTAVMGSYRKGSTYRTVQRFEGELQKLLTVDFQYIFLKDMNLKPCRGCALCIEKGEEFCPLKDDRDKVYDALMQSDGVILATPVYSLQVTALLKSLLDRLAFVFHRPRFFGKTCLPIVVQAVYGMEKTAAYLEEVAGMWGFNICPSVALTLPWDKTLPEEEAQIDAALQRAAADLARALQDDRPRIPSLKEVVMFNGLRSFHAANVGLTADHDYYERQGWFTADYFYPVEVSWYKKMLGAWAGRKSRRQAVETKQRREALP